MQNIKSTINNGFKKRKFLCLVILESAIKEPLQHKILHTRVLCSTINLTKICVTIQCIPPRDFFNKKYTFLPPRHTCHACLDVCRLCFVLKKAHRKKGERLSNK